MRYLREEVSRLAQGPVIVSNGAVIPGVPATVGQTAASRQDLPNVRAMLNTGSRNSGHLIVKGDWTDPAHGRITFGEYAEAWLESWADLKPKTRHQYEFLMRQHIMPTWRAVPLAKIAFGGLTQWVSRLSLGGLGPSAIRQSVFVMSAALDHAVRSGRIRSNPARGLGLPRPKRRDYVYLTHGQALALASEAGRWRLLILLLAYTGLRWGEATSLRVRDIDFDRRRVDVSRAFSDVGGRIVLGTPNRISPGPSRFPGSSPSSWRARSTASAPTTSSSPCPAGALCGCPTGGGPPSSPLAPGQVSAIASASMT